MPEHDPAADSTNGAHARMGVVAVDLPEVDAGRDAQQLLARLAGNYRRGNQQRAQGRER